MSIHLRLIEPAKDIQKEKISWIRCIEQTGCSRNSSALKNVQIYIFSATDNTGKANLKVYWSYVYFGSALCLLTALVQGIPYRVPESILFDHAVICGLQFIPKSNYS